ncbi:hypothetical protein HDU84_004043 [Entophlyctis sp. JEL0112]|nr:hypothetical protein HDU84_004043 [Entophlyctis sp. JEL0112]
MSAAAAAARSAPLLRLPLRVPRLCARRARSLASLHARHDASASAQPLSPPHPHAPLPRPITPRPLLLQQHSPLSPASVATEILEASTDQPYRVFRHRRPFKLHLGGELPEFQIAFETWGELNEKKDNVVLVTTGLSAASHAKSNVTNPKAGWWEKFIGPGLSIDTTKFHVICTNVIGGCFGSTGPSSINPATGHEYGPDFPMLTIWDIVRAQFRLLDGLGIDRLHAVVGSSMGGMVSLAATALFPDRVGRVASISAAARSHPYSIALRHAQRQVLMSDPNWNGGRYYKTGVIPAKGLNLARQIGTITYRSGPEWEVRFGRKRADPTAKPGLGTDFMIESYLEHQGKKWAFDANSLLYLSRAMDMFDMSDRPDFDPNFPETMSKTPQLSPEQEAVVAEEKTVTDYAHTHHLTNGLSTIQCPALVIGVKSDFLIPSWQQKEIALCLQAAGNNDVTHFEIDGVYGHDTFLLDLTNIGSAVKGHLESNVSRSVPGVWFI